MSSITWTHEEKNEQLPEVDDASHSSSVDPAALEQADFFSS